MLFFSHRTPPIISLGTCISAYIPFLNRWWANWDKLDSQFLPLIFFHTLFLYLSFFSSLSLSTFFFSLFLVFSVYHRSWTVLARTQSTCFLQHQNGLLSVTKSNSLHFVLGSAVLYLLYFYRFTSLLFFFPFFSLFMSWKVEILIGYAVFCLRGCSVFVRCSTVSIFCGIHSILRGPYALLLAFEMKACERWNLCSSNLIKKVGFVRMWKLFFFFFIIC